MLNRSRPVVYFLASPYHHRLPARDVKAISIVQTGAELLTVLTFRLGLRICLIASIVDSAGLTVILKL